MPCPGRPGHLPVLPCHIVRCTGTGELSAGPAARHSDGGAAATNATLAFFGGGSLAAGGLGMAGGMAVLGDLVAGPALAVMGLITGAKAQEKVNKALESKAEADAVVESLNSAAYQCSAIRRRTYMLYTLLSHLDAQFLPLIWKMQKVVETEGFDYRQYTSDSK